MERLVLLLLLRFTYCCPPPVLGQHLILLLLSRVLPWTVKSNFSDDIISPSPVRLRRQRGQVWVWERKMQLKHLSWPQESIRHRRWDLKQIGVKGLLSSSDSCPSCFKSSFKDKSKRLTVSTNSFKTQFELGNLSIQILTDQIPCCNFL